MRLVDRTWTPRGAASLALTFRQGLLVGALSMGLSVLIGAGIKHHREKAAYRSDTGLLVIQLRNRDGSVAEFFGDTDSPLGDFRAPLKFPADPMVAACIDFAARMDRRADKRRGVKP